MWQCVYRTMHRKDFIVRKMVGGEKMRGNSKCKPQPLNQETEYSSLLYGECEDDDGDCSHDEEEHLVSLKKRHKEEIHRLKNRIAKLESALKIRKNLEDVFVMESSSSSSSSSKESAGNESSDGEDALVPGDETQDTPAQYSGLLPPSEVTHSIATTGSTLRSNDLLYLPHIDYCEALLEKEGALSTRSELAQDIPIGDPIYLGTEKERSSCGENIVSPPSGACFLSPSQQTPIPDGKCCSLLTKDQVERYSRHLLLADGFGVSGQVKLLQSAVLVVGAGGIGSTVLLYLAACGVGSIGVVDFDCVESSNLHRQIIHSSTKVGMNKALSAVSRMRELNPTINFAAIQEGFNHQNATRIVASYDCIVDASDNAFTRYLVNDACVLKKKPLVSGSSIGAEGQLTVHNYLGGPCYRCLYPKASPSEACKSCSDNGVLGPVPGLIGVLQAIEVIKILTGIGSTMHDKMLMYDALQCFFLSIKKIGKRKSCAVCGPDATIKCMNGSLRASLADNQRAPATVMPSAGFPCIKNDNHVNLILPSISCSDYFRQVIQTSEKHILLDVRVERQFAIVSLKASINIPLESLHDKLPEVERLSDGNKPVFCICRRGIASSEATRVIADSIASGMYPNIHSVRNITGGLVAWANEVDTDFPLY